MVSAVQQDGRGAAKQATSRVEEISQVQSDTLSTPMVPQALYVRAASRDLNETLEHHAA